LKNCLDYPRLRQALDTLPKTLDDTYARILESIPDGHITQAATILNLLVWSDWKFKIHELVDAIAVNLDEGPAFDPKNRMPVPRDVLKLCSSLVVVFKGEWDTNTEMAQLAHFSVKEYLISNHVSGAFKSLISGKVANSYLAKLCLRYLVGVRQLALGDQLMSPVYATKNNPLFPFVHYSARCWMDHARETESEDEILFEMIQSFFLVEHKAFSLFEKMYNDHSYHHSPLYYAAAGGLKRMVEHLLDGDQDGERDIALETALAKGQDTIAYLFLDRGADIKAREALILDSAITGGRDTTVQLLLDRGVDANIGDGWPLCKAVIRGQDTTVKLLLDWGVNPNAGKFRALYEAVKRGQDTTVQLLLDRGADANGVNGQPLMIAVEHRKDTTLKLLLDWGADANAGNSRALYEAIKRGQDTTVQLLLDGGADARSDNERLLHAAVCRGYDTIAKLLIDGGANPNAYRQLKPTTLQEILVWGYQSLVDLLQEGDSRVTALESIVMKRYHNLARVLVEKGANINVAGGDWFDTLRTGVWSVQIVRRILEKNSFLSANHLLSAMFDSDPQAEEIILVMLPYLTLERAAQARYPTGMNLLHYSAVCGIESVARRCLDLGVNIYTYDDLGRTALHCAAEYGCITIVKMLVRAGSNIEALNDEHKTPLECAHKDVVYRLLPEKVKKRIKRVPSRKVIEYLSERAREGVPSSPANQNTNKRKRSLEDTGANESKRLADGEINICKEPQPTTTGTTEAKP
jgi:ankyrin repeat protein